MDVIKIEKYILKKIDKIIEDEDNPFVYNYYKKLLEIKEILKEIIIKLDPYQKYYNINKNYIKEINNILDYGYYDDNFDDNLDNYKNKLSKFLHTINIIIS